MASRDYFPKVKEAREALRERAIELFELQLAIIKEAIAKGDLETAAKANQWLMEHMPKEDGESMIASSIDKEHSDKGAKVGPGIQIGIALGGIPSHTKALKGQVIDVTNERTDNS